MMRLPALILVVVFAGCSDPSTTNPQPEPADPIDWRLPVVGMDHATKCLLNTACLANPDSPRSQRYLGEFGITAITEDRYVPFFVRAHGDWVVWDGNHDDTYQRSDIVAYNAQTRELYGLAFGQESNLEGHRPFLDDGRVVFQVVSRNYTGLAIWYAGADDVLPIVTPTGSFYLHDFEGDWIAFDLRHAGEDSGEYVWNIETGEGYRYFEPSTDPEQRIRDVDLNHDSVFYIYQERDASASRGWRDYAFQINLATRALQVLPSPGAENLVGLEVGGRGGVFRAGGNSNQDILEFTLGEQEWAKPLDGNGDCYFDGKGELVWGYCGGASDGRFFVYQLGSEEPTFWSFNSNGTAFIPNQQAFDGVAFYSTGRASTDMTAGVHRVPIFSGR